MYYSKKKIVFKLGSFFLKSPVVEKKESILNILTSAENK